MTQRRSALSTLVAEHDLDGLVLYGAERAGSAVPWLTGWPVTREAAVLFRPGEVDRIWVQFYNHLPNARRLAPNAEVTWGGPSTMAAVCAAIAASGIDGVGVIGPLGHAGHQALTEAAKRVLALDRAYARLRMVKSPEEVDWMRRGAELSDRAVERLRAEAGVGMNEYQLGAVIESAYLAEGGINHIHYLGATSMEHPDLCVPAQWPSPRRLDAGDVLVTEISASWWGYAGQVLRTMTVAAEPTPLYAEMHAVAEAAYARVLAVIRPGAKGGDLVAAASMIEDAGFTIYDDLVHGYGGGYLAPVLRLDRDGPHCDLTLEAGMTVVIQPNVITPDERAGVQTGGLVLVTNDGATPLQQAEPGLWLIGTVGVSPR